MAEETENINTETVTDGTPWWVIEREKEAEAKAAEETPKAIEVPQTAHWVTNADGQPMALLCDGELPDGYTEMGEDEAEYFKAHPTCTAAELAEKPSETVAEKRAAAAREMDEIEQRLAAMDYLTSKELDGEDMSEYGDYKSERKQLRTRYRELELIVK